MTTTLPVPLPARVLLLGSGELGKEVVIALQRYGCTVIACDSYADAPAMQVADESRVFDMSDPVALRAVLDSVDVDLIVPEVEAIATDELSAYEERGVRVVPNAFPVPGRRSPVEPLEHLGLLLLRQAHPRVGHVNPAEQLISGHRHGDRPAGGGVLHPVVQQVAHRLLRPLGVKPRLGLGGQQGQCDPLPVRLGLESRHRLFQHRGQGPHHRLKGQDAVLQAGGLHQSFNEGF